MRQAECELHEDHALACCHDLLQCQDSQHARFSQPVVLVHWPVGVSRLCLPLLMSLTSGTQVCSTDAVQDQASSGASMWGTHA